LTFALLLASVALLAAGAALVQARSASRRAERLAESYWELRYEIGQLKARANRVEAVAGVGTSEPTAEPPAPKPPAQTTSFVPLSSLKK
jgi:type II secretory pathway component PulJ